MKPYLVAAWLLFWFFRISLEDMRRFVIPNRFTLAVLAAAPFLDSVPVSARLLAAALPLVFIPLMGMGDVKLYSALGFMLGPRSLLRITCLSLLAGGVYAAVLLVTGAVKRRDRIAFGPFIAGAAAMVMVGQVFLSA